MATTAKAPANTKVFEHVSIFKCVTPEQVYAFHAAPGAFAKLTPPPIIVQMHHNGLKGLTAGEVEFTLWMGPLPVRWKAAHAPGKNSTSFVDDLVTGPMAYWHHEHLMTAVEGGTELRDRLTIAHKASGFWSIFSRLMFDGLPLRFLFVYRHLRTRWGVGAK
jgi:ligand-binding SRPBCC domain-containing protein